MGTREWDTGGRDTGGQPWVASPQRPQVLCMIVHDVGD